MSRQPQKRSAGTWKPGQSGNPRGRPRSGLALAEKIRDDIPPERITALAARVLDDESLSPAQRLRELLPLVQLGYHKPPTSMALDVSSSSAVTPRAYDALPLEQRLAALELLESAPKLDSGASESQSTESRSDVDTTRTRPTEATGERPADASCNAAESADDDETAANERRCTDDNYPKGREP